MCVCVCVCVCARLPVCVCVCECVYVVDKGENEWIRIRSYKNLFLRKKKPGWLRAALDSAGVKKGDVVPDSAAPKRNVLLFIKNL